MTFDQSQNENGHAEALPPGQVGRCTRREPKRSVASGVADRRRFGVEHVEQPVSEGRSSGTSRALAQPGAAADAVECRRLSNLSWPARLIFFRWAARGRHALKMQRAQMTKTIPMIVIFITLLLGLPLSALADFTTAVAAHNRGDYAAAFREFKALAEKGDSSSQYNLAQMYAGGKGVPQDYEAAAGWFLKAADQGDAGAQSFLGQMYFAGHGVNQSYRAAAQWWRKAAEQGDAPAQFNLGSLYLNGQGVKQSHQEALIWHHKAAKKGFAMAQNNLGFMYANGYGVPQDYVQAYMWGSLAAAQGLELAIKLRNDLTARMTSAQIAEAQRLVSNWRPVSEN